MIYPRIVWNATTLDATLSARPFRHGLPQGIGAGIEHSASGLPSVWVTRWERRLTVVQRITEAEWPAFRAWLEWAMAGGTFTWASASGGTAHTCYLVSPDITTGGDLTQLPYPGDQELTYTIRRTDGAAIDEVSYV